MTRQVGDPVERWLDEAAQAMGGDAERRRDVLLELESTIHDRVDERVRRGEARDAAVDGVLGSLGDPEEIGSSVMPGRPLLDAKRTRSFILRTAILFAAHFLLVIGATVAGRELSLSVLRIRPIADPRSFLSLLAHALETLCFDAGLMLVIHAALPRFARFVRLPRPSLAVTIDPRRTLEGAFFLALVAVAVNPLRDRLLALYVPSADGVVRVPLAGPGLLDSLLFLNLWLGLAIARDLAYARFRERRLTLALDLASCAAGLFCLLRIVASERVLDLAGAQAALGPSADSLGALMNATFSLLALATTALLAARAARRAFRLVMMRGTRPA